MLINVRGLGCPKPVMMTQDALAKIDEGIVEILVDNEASVYNLSRFASKKWLLFRDNKRGQLLDSKNSKKGYVCKVPQKETKQKEPEKDLFLLVATDTMGKDEELGKILMKGFLEAIKVSKKLPHTIFFLNKGVRLTTLNEESIQILKELEASGVDIFTCGTGLKYYDLESELKVGYRGTTDKIIEGMKDFKNTIWIW